MIHEIKLARKKFLQFKNKGEAFKFNVPKPYKTISSFLQLEDGFILIMGWDGEDAPNLTDEKRRRNVIKISDKAEFLWQVADKYAIWEKKAGKGSLLKSQIRSPFDQVKKMNDKIILVHADTGYFLNPKTGEIEYWKTDRWGI